MAAARLTLSLLHARPHNAVLSLRRAPTVRALETARLQGATRNATPRPLVRAMAGGADLVGTLKQKNQENPVIVYSKTYCPYCSEVKGLFKQLGVPHKVVELDELADGAAVQDALRQVTGRSTVPQVFVGGQHVGGCDDTLAAHSSGKLSELLAAAGVSAT